MTYLSPEWLESDGRGGFASGGINLIPTRKYHGILISSDPASGRRQVLCNAFDVTLQAGDRSYPLSSFRFGENTIHPNGHHFISNFTAQPWPRWEFSCDGVSVTHEIAACRDARLVIVSWKIRAPESLQCTLRARPLLSGRDYHSLHRENGAFRFETVRQWSHSIWQPYEGLPPVHAWSDGEFFADRQWYRNFCYDHEVQRGFPGEEDLASPGYFEWKNGSSCYIALSTEQFSLPDEPSPSQVAGACEQALEMERTRRRSFTDQWEAAGDGYIVKLGRRSSIIAGFPWFTDWGRDTFISLRGLALATGRLDLAREILVSWSEHISRGMIPNRFPDAGEAPEFNAVDASLWYLISICELFAGYRRFWRRMPGKEKRQLTDAAQAILEGYSAGTRYSIHADSDGLLAAGEPGVQLTWMDAKIGDWVVTPRIGKPVEVQALWINALDFGGSFSGEWRRLAAKARGSFGEKFWNPESNSLYDCIDCDHIPGSVDPSVRPNQIFAVGGLPAELLTGERAAAVVKTVEDELLTPTGLRSLSPASPSYRGRYEGGPFERDSAYHQGTVWPWLMGPFIEAWVRVRGGSRAAKEEAKRRFMEPLAERCGIYGMGHLAEIADGDAPFTPRGCPFQAWSVAEALRVIRTVL